MSSTMLKRALDATWTTRDLERGFRKSAMTIHLWRRRLALPVIVIPGRERPAIRYSPRDVLAWAKAHGKEWYGL